MTNENIFWKLSANESLIMACLQICRQLLSLSTFLRVHANSKEVSYISWQNTYPNLKTDCHIKLKLFLWTKLIENLLLAKYLISVRPPLIEIFENTGCCQVTEKPTVTFLNKILLAPTTASNCLRVLNSLGIH